MGSCEVAVLRAGPRGRPHAKSAWHMLHRVWLALKSGPFEKMAGEIELTNLDWRARQEPGSLRPPFFLWYETGWITGSAGRSE